MTEYAIQTFDLTKKYNGIAVLNNVCLNVPTGSIYGLIGRNGAGKSTIMRILMGSAEPTSGYFSLFGNTHGQALYDSRQKTGSIIDTPSLYGSMTALQNIMSRCILLGVKNAKQRTEELLDFVGLINDKSKKVKNFSLGMKQRLALAVALIDDPKLLILDEPINGLDPLGIQSVRNILAEVNSRGTTIMISSHLLGELSRLATVYGIIENGRLIKEVKEAEINLGNSCIIDIGLADINEVSKCVSLLSPIVGESGIKLESFNHIKLKTSGKISIEGLTQLFLQNQIKFTSVNTVSMGIEEYFLEVIKGSK